MVNNGYNNGLCGINNVELVMWLQIHQKTGIITHNDHDSQRRATL